MDHTYYLIIAMGLRPYWCGYAAALLGLPPASRHGMEYAQGYLAATI